MPLLRPSLLLPQAVTSWCFDRDPLIRGKPALLLYTFLARTRRRDFVKWSIRARRGDGVVEMSNALRVYAARPEHELYPQSIESETALISSSLPTFLRGVEGLSYENFLSETSFLIIRTRSNANGTGRSCSCSYSCRPLAFSSRDCFSIGPLPPCPPSPAVNTAFRSPAHRRCTCRAV
jgi:hypothetical protein